MAAKPQRSHFRSHLFRVSLLLALAVLPALSAAQKPGAPKARKTTAEPIQALTITPPDIRLNGLYTEARVLVDGLRRSGPKDLSGVAQFVVADPKIAEVDENGTVRPRQDGKTTLLIRAAGKTARVPITVQGIAHAGPPSFLNEVIPVLTRAGCNMGACHGAGSGKGGLKLSLQGYDPDADYVTITRAAGARRISRRQPENSLLLRKPTLAAAHRGGLRLKVGSPEYRLLRDWIAKGLPGPIEKEPQVVRLEVFPKVRTLALGETQAFRVKAIYSDGAARDVTSQTLFAASDETVATVTPKGVAKATGPGEGATLIRYQDLVATARVISPFSVGARGQGPGARANQLSLTNSRQPTADPTSATIDRLVQQKLDALGLEPSSRCSDADFLRRATLDVIGLLPRPEEVRAFVADRDPQKREKLVAALLARPEYVDYWTLRWGDILRSARQKLSLKGMYAFNFWLRQSVAENKPWNQFAQELLLAQGSNFTRGAANYYRTATSPQEMAETTSQVFLGVRIQCAKCHNHPYERWKQDQYYQMAAFFARVRSKGGDRPGEQVVYLAESGEVKHLRTQKEVGPQALDAQPVPADFRGDRRAALAEWLTSEKNPFFTHVLVNRLWRHFLGRGFVEPVDDLRVTNPPSNETLFDWLAQDFARHGYDVKRLMRAILLSETYQRAAEPTKNNARDTKYYSHYAFKRLGAEQLMDAISAATGVPEKFDGLPTGMRATELPDAGVASYFLDLFGRPARNVACECERSDDPNLGQVLHLMNNAGINGRIAAKEGRVAQLIEAKVSDAQLVEELYLASVSRFPTPSETQAAVKILTRAKDRQKAAEDILWALINSKEFLFNH